MSSGDNVLSEIKKRALEITPEIDVDDITLEYGSHGMVHLRAGLDTIGQLLKSINMVWLIGTTGAPGFSFKTRMYPCPDCQCNTYRMYCYEYDFKDNEGNPVPCDEAKNLSKNRQGVRSWSQVYLQKCLACGCWWRAGTRERMTPDITRGVLEVREVEMEVIA